MPKTSSTSSSDKKRIGKRTLAVILTIALFAAGLYGMQELTRAKTARARDLRYKTFFANPEEYEVIFLGSSHMMYGVNPMVIWNKTGITSFNWGSPTCTIPSSYWKLQNIMDYETPKLVVLDCFRASWIQKTYNEYRLHEALDAFPLSYTKYLAVNDLMRGEAYKENDGVYTDVQRYNLLFPLYAYHSRGEELEKTDFVNDYTDTKGCEFEINVATPIEISHTKESTPVTPDMQGIVYLKKTIAYCQEQGIPILLTYLPYPTDEPWKMESNMIAPIAEEYGVPYLNFTDMDVVDYDTDYSDPDSHMNISGQEKVSEFLADYIATHYEIAPMRDDETVRAEWDALYDAYEETKREDLKQELSLRSYLMLLRKTSDHVIVKINDPSVLESPVHLRLLYGMMTEQKTLDEDTAYIVLSDGHTELFGREDAALSGIGSDVTDLLADDETSSLRIVTVEGEELVNDVSFSYTGEDLLSDL